MNKRLLTKMEKKKQVNLSEVEYKFLAKLLSNDNVQIEATKIEDGDDEMIVKLYERFHDKKGNVKWKK